MEILRVLAYHKKLHFVFKCWWWMLGVACKEFVMRSHKGFIYHMWKGFNQCSTKTLRGGCTGAGRRTGGTCGSTPKFWGNSRGTGGRRGPWL